MGFRKWAGLRRAASTDTYKSYEALCTEMDPASVSTLVTGTFWRKYPRAFSLSAGYSPAVSKLLYRARPLVVAKRCPRSFVPEMTDDTVCPLVMAHPTFRKEALSPAPGVFSARSGQQGDRVACQSQGLVRSP